MFCRRFRRSDAQQCPGRVVSWCLWWCCKRIVETAVHLRGNSFSKPFKNYKVTWHFRLMDSTTTLHDISEFTYWNTRVFCYFVMLICVSTLHNELFHPQDFKMPACQVSSSTGTTRSCQGSHDTSTPGPGRIGRCLYRTFPSIWTSYKLLRYYPKFGGFNREVLLKWPKAIWFWLEIAKLNDKWSSRAIWCVLVVISAW